MKAPFCAASKQMAVCRDWPQVMFVLQIGETEGFDPSI